MRFQIFRGWFGSGNHTADEEINKWLEQNPNIEIIDFKYQNNTKCNEHSICIMYKELTENETSI